MSSKKHWQRELGDQKVHFKPKIVALKPKIVAQSKLTSAHQFEMSKTLSTACLIRSVADVVCYSRSETIALFTQHLVQVFTRSSMMLLQRCTRHPFACFHLNQRCFPRWTRFTGSRETKLQRDKLGDRLWRSSSRKGLDTNGPPRLKF